MLQISGGGGCHAIRDKAPEGMRRMLKVSESIRGVIEVAEDIRHVLEVPEVAQHVLEVPGVPVVGLLLGANS
jgi:hypothetical protein